MVTSERLKILIRPARETDTPDVMELTSKIWEGEDYVPLVWSEWLADPEGSLAVAEYQGRVVGFGKLSRSSEEDWWLEGLRVHPEYEGRGIASQLHEHLTEAWIRMGSGSLRLATASFRVQVHHLCDRFGFTKVAECTSFVAPALTDQPVLSYGNANGQTTASQAATQGLDQAHTQSGDSPTETFQTVTPDEAQEATNFALHSPTLALSHGLMDLYWRWAPPREIYLSPIIQNKKAWWWRGKRGLLALREVQDPGEEPVLSVQLLACSLEEIGDLLLDSRRLTATLGYSRASWMAPLHPDLTPALEKAGFQRDWDASMYIYTKP